MAMMRWGMPPPPRTGGPPVTNIRNTTSPDWRGWLKPESRCLVPANSFAEYAPEPRPRRMSSGLQSMTIARCSPLAGSGPWHQVEADPRPSPRLRLPDDGSERRGRADVILTTPEQCYVWMRALVRADGRRDRRLPYGLFDDRRNARVP
jgi:hypothetical protein